MSANSPPSSPQKQAEIQQQKKQNQSFMISSWNLFPFSSTWWTLPKPSPTTKGTVRGPEPAQQGCRPGPSVINKPRTDQQRRKGWGDDLPGWIPTNGPYWRWGSPGTLYFHFLITIFIPYADDSVGHPQGKVLAIVCPADKTHKDWKRLKPSSRKAEWCSIIK